jgi:hypothetical protein
MSEKPITNKRCKVKKKLSKKCMKELAPIKRAMIKAQRERQLKGPTIVTELRPIVLPATKNIYSIEG